MTRKRPLVAFVPLRQGGFLGAAGGSGRTYLIRPASRGGWLVQTVTAFFGPITVAHVMYSSEFALDVATAYERSASNGDS